MDILHENLEELCERFGPEQWEVEYSVSEGSFSRGARGAAGSYVITCVSVR
jgi:hypothetical protein